MFTHISTTYITTEHPYWPQHMTMANPPDQRMTKTNANLREIRVFTDERNPTRQMNIFWTFLAANDIQLMDYYMSRYVDNMVIFKFTNQTARD